MKRKRLVATIFGTALVTAVPTLTQAQYSAADVSQYDSTQYGYSAGQYGQAYGRSSGLEANTWRGRSELRVTPYNLTDGNIGGTGVPSASSGAVPSTSPNEDLELLSSRARR